ncbi:MAG: hypothetical protein ABSB42_16450 [Tepidisphaeraceae bacterium]|jgi:hypothetical protein
MKARPSAVLPFALFALFAVENLAWSASAPATDSQGSWPFVHPQDHFSGDAMLDLRGLNEATAGQSGFVRVSGDGGFVRGDGTPIRFWACGTELYLADDKKLASHARFLAKLGVNMVRLHAQIGSDSKTPELTDVNQKQIDGIWRAVAAFKREGIYVTISPYWALDRPATRWGIEGYEHHGDLWGLLFFNPTLQKGYKAWVRKLYAETNPYTGIPLARDPAVAIIQVQNEDGMFFFTMDGMKPAQKRLLGREFAAWLIAQYGSLDKAWDAWDYITQPGDDFPAGEVAILPVWQWTRPQHGGMARRLADQLRFFAETQRGFYEQMVRFYRDELGCRQLINASNWLTADVVRLNDVERYTNTAADVMAVNKYFNSVHDGANTGWRIDPGDHFTDHPGVLNPWDLPTNLKQVVGHPMIVTESTWVAPMDYQDEAPFLVSAYESLAGIAGYYWFTAKAEQYDDDPCFPFVEVNGEHPQFKWTCSTPALMGGFPAAALMYRNGYLKRGQPVVVENRPLADLWNRRPPLISESAGFDPNRMPGQPPQQPQAQTGADPLAFLVGPVTVNYGVAGQNTVADLSGFVDRQKKIVSSNTGEIRLDYNIGMCTIDAPCAQGATGLLNHAGNIHLSTIDIASGNRQASVLVVSLDGQALSESRRILVQVGTPSRLSGWTQEPADFGGNDKKQYHGFRIVKIGKPPWMIENADVTLTIRNTRLTKATALDAAGYLAKESSLAPDGAGVELRFPPRAMYEILQ